MNSPAKIDSVNVDCTKVDCTVPFQELVVQYEDIGPIKLAYRITGAVEDIVDNKRPLMLFIHGWPLNSLTYENIINRLSGELTCIAVDLPGLGKTNWHNQVDLSPKGQAELLLEFMTKQSIERYTIYGNDSGGMIARYLAELDKERVTHLILSNTEIPGERPPWVPLFKKCMNLPGFLPVMRRLLAKKYFVRSPMALGGVFYDKALLGGQFDRDFIQPLVESRSSFRNAMSSFLEVFNWIQLDELALIHPELSMPTLFIWGKDDPTFPEKAARKMVSQLPLVAEFHSISQAKLFVHQEKSEEVSHFIRGFIK